MKKFAIAMLMIAGSVLAQADYKVVNADGSDLSQLCVAAATPAAGLSAAAKAVGVTTAGLATVRCNGLTLERFAAKYGSRSLDTTPVAYVLKGTDDSEATALCLAAARLGTGVRESEIDVLRCRKHDRGRSALQRAAP